MISRKVRYCVQIAVIALTVVFRLTAQPASETDSPLSTPEELAAYQTAAAYSRAHRGVSMIVVRGGEVVFEDYPRLQSAEEAHNLFSGTKSFSGVMAVAAMEDGLLDLDENVSETITEWQDDKIKSQITIRQLLTLTGGIDAGEPGSVPTYRDALAVSSLHQPGTVFQYGPAPFQVFGELMTRKLAPFGETPDEYLVRRVLEPIGVRIDRWKTGDDGNVKMPAGAFLTARDWARLGQLILNAGRWEGREILDADLLAECFRGSSANPTYGLTFWLPLSPGLDSKGHSNSGGVSVLQRRNAPDLIIKAAGVGGQKMYIVPAFDLVVVRQAWRIPLGGWGFSDADFLGPILEAM